MLFKNTYTAIDRDMQRIEPGQHQAVRIEDRNTGGSSGSRE